jgi:hypothetical protein
MILTTAFETVFAAAELLQPLRLGWFALDFAFQWPFDNVPLSTHPYET